VTRPIYQVKADFFKTLGHPVRIRALELLREKERSVGELLAAMDVESSHLSQQLAVLRRASIVRARKEGSSVFYSVADPRVFTLLEVAKSMITTSLTETRELLEELEAMDFEEKPRAAKRR
jgi:ArsR family transcriptional regulator